MKTDEYLTIAAASVERQAQENPDLGIPVDPDLADFMGAFEETAVSIEDFDFEFPHFYNHPGKERCGERGRG